MKEWKSSDKRRLKGTKQYESEDEEKEEVFIKEERRHEKNKT